MNRLTLSTALALVFGFSASASAESVPGKVPSLEKSYLKELAFLKAEKASLEARLAEVEARDSKRIAQAQAELQSLEGRLLGLRREADRVEESLRDADIAALESTGTEVVLETLERAKGPIEAAGFVAPTFGEQDKPTPSALAAAIEDSFRAAKSTLARGGEVRRAKGDFFLTDGTLVQGDIIRVGGIAAYGISDKGRGALAPAGAKKLRLWPDTAAASATALNDGATVPSLRAFLFESLDKAVSPKAEKSVVAEVNSGGIIAWVIVALGFAAFMMMLFRAGTLAIVGIQTRSVLAKVLPAMRAGRVAEARELAKSSSGATARVLRVTLQNMDKAKRKKLDDVIEEAVFNELPAIERFGSAILVFAAVAPLLGLLGTVTGMISTFDVITEFGTGDPRMLSGGISEALVTTKLGLLVAIPALLAGSVLAAQADALVNDIQFAVLRVLNIKDGLHVEPKNQSDRPRRRSPHAVPETAA